MILRVIRIDGVPGPRSQSISGYFLLPPVQAVAVRLPNDQVADPILIHVDYQDGDAGRTQVEIGVEDPVPKIGISGRFQPTLAEDKIATPVPGEVAKSQPVALWLAVQLVSDEFPRAFPIVSGDEFLDHQWTAWGVRNDFQLAVTIDIPGSG